MGGRAFASGPDALSTPRMPPKVYYAVRDRCQEKLRQLFVVAATPIEGPGKSSFGDVDLFVALAQSDKYPLLTHSFRDTSTMEVVCRLLGAVKHKGNNEHMANFAIPWPEDCLHYGQEDAKCDGQNGQPPAESKPLYIQVDIHIFNGPGPLQWDLFANAHGDLWSILREIIRPFHFSVNLTGLYILIPEIDSRYKKRKTNILLSNDPATILNFLSLEFQDGQWEEPFASTKEMFEYAATCRFFGVESHLRESETGISTSKQKFKQNRPVFREFIEDFIPACCASGRFMTNPPTHEEVREQIFASFPGVQYAYEETVTNWRSNPLFNEIWNHVIKTAAPEIFTLSESKRRCCRSALEKIIVKNDTSFEGITAPPNLRREDGFLDEENVGIWVQNNWQDVLKVALRCSEINK
ncbi:hypothetical protein F4808DRAFT_412338 [Astrocystis sublimbata]|nr:hypothetical protein F4808DRAFT_412338 [Astrocystis sublimbata]